MDGSALHQTHPPQAFEVVGIDGLALAHDLDPPGARQAIDAFIHCKPRHIKKPSYATSEASSLPASGLGEGGLSVGGAGKEAACE